MAADMYCAFARGVPNGVVKDKSLIKMFTLCQTVCDNYTCSMKYTLGDLIETKGLENFKEISAMEQINLLVHGLNTRYTTTKIKNRLFI